MIQIKIFVFNPFQENTYLLSDESGECIIVDAGCANSNEESELETYIASKRLKPVRLINTHGHIDHVAGSSFVTDTFHLPLEIHPDEAPLVERARQYGVVFGFELAKTPVYEASLAHGQIIRFGQSEVEVRHVPGHSKGSVALYCSAQNFVITGDVLFRDSIGRTDLEGGSFDELQKSIYTQLFTLDEDCVVYPGHGPSTKIGYERDHNPFLM